NLYFSLGLGDPLPISALHGKGVADLLDVIVDRLRKLDKVKRGQGVADDSALKIAILGRPNAGKSSLVNKLLRQNRMIVDAAPGTTRDAIDSELTYNDHRVVLIDTAGLRKKSQVKDNVEYYSNLRALGSIQRSDVCILLVDAVAGLGEQDLKILDKILEFNKGSILAWNKWDIVEKDSKTFDRLSADVKKQYAELRNRPILSISALTGLRINMVLEQAFRIKEKMHYKVPSKEFSDKVYNWTRLNPHPISGGKDVRILAGKQRPAEYPLFIFYASNFKNVVPSYKRYLINKIYENYDFEGCPVRVSFRPPGRRTHQ
ncbi:MAG: ribosome biogenesis GTPase Der, partial [Chitinivibrionales bacterium]|nr:ribosome biogenesis GTPase Der [Chitinivibrionales bacterium]